MKLEEQRGYYIRNRIRERIETGLGFNGYVKHITTVAQTQLSSHLDYILDIKLSMFCNLYKLLAERKSNDKEDL